MGALIIRQRSLVWCGWVRLMDCHASKNCMHEGQSDDLPHWEKDVACHCLRLSRLSVGCIA